MSSVRNRLFVLIAGTALLASLSIGVAYLATESERLDARADAHAVADLYNLAVLLSNAIRDQDEAVSDYLLASAPEALDRYGSAVENELHLAERMRLAAADDPDVVSALETLEARSRVWRASFATLAMAAVSAGSQAQVAKFVETVSADKEPTLTGINDLVSRISEAEASAAAQDDALTRTRALATAFGIALMLLAAAASLGMARRWVTRPLDKLLTTATDVESGANVAFVTERDDEIGKLGVALERMRFALQQDAGRSGILNRFTEVTTFAADDEAVAVASLEALRMLVQPDAAVSHVLNRSKDRAVPEAKIGSPVAEVLPLNSLSRCPAIVRGSIYVTPDAEQPLSVHCPIYPVEHGTLACVPLAHGETVGSIHLFWERPNAFRLDQRSIVTRIAEHAALAISNRRLMAALQGMASTDPRTGLSNTRAFDQMLEDALRARRDDETIAVLMLDLDHFKEFNDRYGHPAGDEALRAFADILRSCLRDGDVAARYGGEEFAIFLPTVDQMTALTIAERIRSRTESTLIALAPGISDRITVSIGLASAPHQANDRIALLRLADEALYQAKEAGRNQVVTAGASTADQAALRALASELPLPTVVSPRRLRRRVRTAAES
jgi:diguanylate cyclase (GGDEF)-like protein